MILQTIAFYLFATILIASALMVIASKNPVHSVLFLILAFFNGAGLFVLLGAEFLAMILVVVYVGAVAVLFLFVVMPLGALIGFILALELGSVGLIWAFAPAAKTAAASVTPANVSNTQALGAILYTQYV